MNNFVVKDFLSDVDDEKFQIILICTKIHHSTVRSCYPQTGEFQAIVAESALLGVHVDHFFPGLTSVYNLAV